MYRVGKTFLDVEDVQEDLLVGRTKAYQIIAELNKESKTKTFRGKVLARTLYEAYGMTEKLSLYKKSMEDE